MKGQVIVGTGVDASDSTSDSGEKSESTPGFVAIGSIVALIGAAAFLAKRE